MAKLIVQSHRVAGITSPEDVLQLFHEAWAKGYIPEADVRTTRDGVMVDFHDTNFTRVIKDANPELQLQGVQDFAFDAIAALDAVWKDEAGNRQRVCRIDSLFEELSKRADKELYLDIKKVNLPQLAELARQFHVENRVILTSPNVADSREWKTLIPEGQTLLWMGGDMETLPKRFANLRETDFAGITQLQIHVRLIEGQFQPPLDFLREVADELIARDILFQVLPWDVDDAETHRALLGAGVQSFASDYPQVALEALRDWYCVNELSVEEAP